ncbi:site-specific DNA-methyltransferase [Pseudomonas kermanshahensis]|uniref:site-specific DNA-methyltransferase n=1 Tax=Pseudomonas kermanshahensis TaxID=2745482 RepID=UPI0023DA550D|nr:site-specific DNA-methyltransferase [Pseudomonas kermanshahensis]WEL54934.1 site-specific DNA-methyltransferase [Pseudomonas kermanshahensis]
MTLQKIDAQSPEAQSADLKAENIAKLKALFPELITEGPSGVAINQDVLKQLVGDGSVTDADEKYGLNWHGKRAARQLALTPSTGTLLPCPDDSVDWDTTQNLMIEGDNLEVLKLLQKSYAGKIKMIYIDPPYNTGSDFVYPDDFRNSIENYKSLTGQANADGRSLSSNAETSGRFHTDWLNMMYPRLKLARNLLAHDGTIFISIDDKEVAHLRTLCDEVFGAENLIAEMIWEGANKNDARQIGVCHEYVLVYAKNRDSLPREWSLKKEGTDAVFKESKRLLKKHDGDFNAASEELANWYRSMKATESFAHRRYRFIDARGIYKEENPTAPGGRRFQLKNPKTGADIRLRDNRGWAFDQEQFNKLVDEDRIVFVTESSVMQKLYLHETDKITPPSVFYQPARSASERLGKLMDGNVFDFPKDETILSKLVEMSSPSNEESIILDFFAGSGTTAHATLSQNAADSGNRRYILVQLPEPLSEDKKEQKAAATYCDNLGKPRTIAELTKERLRRAAQKIKNNNPMFSGDTGFRVFKLDTSNIHTWNPCPADLERSLLDSQEHIRSERSEADVLTEILLKLGLDLCVPIERQQIAGQKVHSIGGGVLMACLAEHITRDKAEELAQGMVAWHKAQAPASDSTCVFRDSAFADDIAKTNLAAILNQAGIKNVRSL